MFGLLFGLLAMSAPRAEPVAPLVELTQSDVENLGPQVLLLADESGRLSPFDILQPEYANKWTEHRANSISRGYDDTPFWVQFRLDASQSIHKEWHLVLSNPLLDYVDVYQVFGNSGPRLIYRSGLQRPNQSRIEDHRYFIIPVEVYGPTTYLMRIETSPAALVPLHAYPSDDFWSPLLKADIGNWLFYGVLLAMVLYNGFLFTTVRDVSYLFYVLFMSSFGLLQLSLDGYVAQYLWPSGQVFQSEYNFWITVFTVIFACFFVIHFLNLRQTSRAHLWALYAMVALQLTSALLLLTIELDWFAQLYAPTLLLFMALAISAGVRAWRVGFMAAKFFVLAWVLFALGNSVFLLGRLFGVEPPLPPNLASKLGAFAEAMLLSFALAYRIRLLRDEQERQRMRVEAQSQFLAQISHEIRTPLNGVLGMTEVLSRTRLDNEQRGYVETIQGSGSSLLALINDILDYSKIEAGKMAFRREPVDVHQLVQQQVKLFLSQAEHKSLLLTGDIEPVVPAWVMLDAQHVRQVLSNLVSNAIKYTDKGAVKLTLGIDPNAPRLLEFRVEDTGIGISEVDQQNLFNLYSDVDPGRQRQAGGTGLGLAISRELVALMGGTLMVTSEPNQGSCFTVRLPFLQARPRREEARLADPVPQNGLRVLVAEDNLVNQHVIQGLLEKLGHQSTLVNHGGEALEVRQAEAFDGDVLLMDCEMPHMDGYEATEAIRAYEKRHNLPRLPIVALTAHALEDVRRRCIESGMDEFLTKPINTRQLERVLGQLTRENQDR
ncbi:hybrid sensor histidine kinase/response regulator [Saccharospirillum impatiens]|uniref:hybrid sensor histidine kinase/response regulator n=1 Tax=Saccharospirillum impatiens TaxID=169438 RepID=UPI00040292EC|nr:hybrid sensor histidine kinase/response regulator [Saccharospirillum impatiens]